MTREEFNKLRSNGKVPCPDCGERSTHPSGGCWCPSSETGYGTKHINENHHTCRWKLIGDIKILTNRDYTLWYGSGLNMSRR